MVYMKKSQNLNMEITKATINDVQLIAEFGRRLNKLHFEFDPQYYIFDEKNFAYSFGDWLRNQLAIPSSIILVAKENNEVIGFLSGFVKYLFPWFNIKRVGHISFMFIDERYRRKGVGKQLINYAKDWFKEQGLAYIELYVNERNAQGLTFWKSMVFADFQKFLRMRI